MSTTLLPANSSSVLSPERFKSKRYVVKRDGSHQSINFGKIVRRIELLCYGLNPDYVDPTSVAQKIIEKIYSGISTVEIDEITSSTCADNAQKHPDFSVLAGRIGVSNLHKQTGSSWADIVQLLHDNTHEKTGNPTPLVSDEFNDIVQDNKEKFEAMIDYSRDFQFEYFGLSTLMRSYLLRIHGKVVERPQMLYMRVAVFIHGSDFAKVKETYDLMSTKYFTHATPTLFNAGTVYPQASSCFLLDIRDDSIHGIYSSLSTVANISKYAGGVGIAVHKIRAKDSYIAGTGGTSNGIMPMLQVFNATARYVDQGGGKRAGSFAIYLEPWHADIEEFLKLKLNFGKEEERARDLFYAIWTPDLFMERVRSDGMWSLFCPNEAPGLDEVYGHEFVELYERYESEGRARKTMKALSLFNAIVESQIETGTPYMLSKDACNAKSAQKHIGIIKSSNLCTEIVEHTSKDEIAVCNLASICLNSFVKCNNDGFMFYDFEELERVVRVVTRNLDIIITKNFYPAKEAKYSNTKNRPVGIGVQGYADAVAMMKWSFDDNDAMAWNKRVFETIYMGAVKESIQLAKELGSFPSYEGSPASKGVLQFDMWGLKEHELYYDWSSVRSDLATYGMRNSLLVALMPTASTAQIFGNNEAFEPFTSNIYKRRVLAGEFIVVNKYLVNELCEHDLWHSDVRNAIIARGGSVQGIPCIPDDIRRRYRTVWEISQKKIIDMSADRAPFIDQSQSLNIHIADPTVAKLQTCHFHAYKRGLKTWMYYLRSKGKAQAQKYTIEQDIVKHSEHTDGIVTVDEEEGHFGMCGTDDISEDGMEVVQHNDCLMCSS